MALAATTANSHAALVQITLTGNKISSAYTGGNTLNADLTGDAQDDFEIVDATVSTFGALIKIKKEWGFGGMSHWAMFRNGRYRVGIGDYEYSSGGRNGTVVQSMWALMSWVFIDGRINGGAATHAWVEMHAFNESQTSHTVQFTRVIFDDASTTPFIPPSRTGVQTEWSAVPEPSSFALLSLGAAGLLARRRRQAA